MKRFSSVRVTWVAFAVLASFGCRNSEPTAAPAASAPVAAPAPAAATRVQTVTFHTNALGVDKQFLVYLPKTYDAKPARHYPVFYYLNGLGGNETNWAKGGHIDEAADALGLEAIIVMPDGDDSFYIDSAEPGDYDACKKDGTGLFNPMEPRDSTCVHDRKYETYITSDLIGYVDAHYRTIASRDGRAIAGLSMGGYGALMLAGRHPDLFSATASHSGVDSLFYEGPHPYDAAHVRIGSDVTKWGTTVEPIGAWVRGLFGTDKAFWDAHDPVPLLTKLGPGKLAIYLDCGTEDDFGLDAQATYLHDQLTANHIAHEFFVGPGRHNFSFWQAREPESLKFLRDHTTAAK
ncbi:MAG TPA: alpha/beta hydrolase family protein [Kofleriaceae bacterium]